MSSFVSPQFIIYKIFTGTKLQAGNKIYVIVCKKKKKIQISFKNLNVEQTHTNFLFLFVVDSCFFQKNAESYSPMKTFFILNMIRETITVIECIQDLLNSS